MTPKRSPGNLFFWVGHVNWCWRRQEEEAAAGAYPRVCKFQQCLDTKDLVQHATQCTAGNHCPVAHCALTNGIFRHYETCTFESCWVCQQLHRVPRCADRARTTGNVPAVERPMPEAAKRAHFEGTVADHKDQTTAPDYQGSEQHAVEDENGSKMGSVAASDPSTMEISWGAAGEMATTNVFIPVSTIAKMCISSEHRQLLQQIPWQYKAAVGLSVFLNLILIVCVVLLLILFI